MTSRPSSFQILLASRISTTLHETVRMSADSHAKLVLALSDLFEELANERRQDELAENTPD